MKYFSFSKKHRIDLIENIILGNKEKVKQILTSQYEDNLLWYIKQEHKIHNVTKRNIFLRLTFKEFIESDIAILSALKTKKQITERLKNIASILCNRFTNGEKVLEELDALFGLFPEIENEIDQKAQQKPFADELFIDRVHDSVQNRKVVNNIPTKYYLLALQKLPYASNRKLAGSKSGHEKLLRCRDIILFRNFFNKEYTEISPSFKGIYNEKAARTWATHLSECMGKLIELALILKKEDDIKMKNKGNDFRTR